MKNKYNSHDINLDILRCIAVITVFQVHFLLNVKFYKMPIDSAETVVMCVMATVFRVCVPLFLLLTGYLQSSKRLTPGYYKGAIRILVTYLITSVIYIVLMNKMNLKAFTFRSAVLAILSSAGSNYAWYIEMYLGLFILIPFLNILWEKLDTHNKRLALVVTFAVLTVVPKMLNTFDFQTEGWFAQPSLSNRYDVLFPDWWASILYPVSYYFIGAYIRTENVKLRKSVNILLLLVAALLFSTTNYLRSRNGLFVSGAPADWGSVSCTVISVLVFTLVKDLKFTSKLPKPIKYCVSRIAYLSLSMYLLSAVADAVLYKALLTVTTDAGSLLMMFPVITGTVFVSAAVASEVADRIAIHPLTWLAEKGYSGCVKLIEKRAQKKRAVPSALTDDKFAVAAQVAATEENS